MNPYHKLFDRQDDQAEHAHELAVGMAVPYKYSPPNDADKWWTPMRALDEHRAVCATLRAELRAAAKRAAS